MNVQSTLRQAVGRFASATLLHAYAVAEARSLFLADLLLIGGDEPYPLSPPACNYLSLDLLTLEGRGEVAHDGAEVRHRYGPSALIRIYGSDPLTLRPERYSVWLVLPRDPEFPADVFLTDRS